MLRGTVRNAAGAVALVVLGAFGAGLGIWAHKEPFVSKFAGGDPDERSAATTPGEGPIGGFEAYWSAIRTYPADEIPPSVASNGSATFLNIANQDAQKGDPGAKGHKFSFFGPLQSATQPGVTSFSGATNVTASRITAMLVAPNCSASQCRIWVGASGGGVWRTDNALADNPDWKELHPGQLDQASVGALAFDPSDKTWSTIYLGTGEGNRCSSGCEAGVGIYKSTNNGETWVKLEDQCVDNPTNPCANHGDTFLGRAINAIVVDPANPNHLLVGMARGVRGLSHVIGSGGQSTLEPNANLPGLYESTDGGATFTMVWDGAKPDTPGPVSLGVTDLALDPLDPNVVYVSAFDAGMWRRDAGASSPTAFSQVFKPQFFQNSAIDRTMFALTVKNGKTRIYLTDGTANGAGVSGALAANFWRVDNANQSAAALLASQGACVAPAPSTTFPQTYNGWQCLTSKTTSSPYFATDDFCTGQCWYDERVYTPPGMPDIVYVIGSNQYGEQPCNTDGVGCGNGRSNGREVLYSDTAGDPDGANNSRTFTDLSYDATISHPNWCAYAPYFNNGCENAPNGIHPDQHVIAINPGNPTQIFEGSDGGLIRTSGQFADISSQCDSQFRNGGTPLPITSGSYLSCKRLLSRVPTLLTHIDKKLSSSLQFINVAINPQNSSEIMGGTQDNGTWSNIGSPSGNAFTQVIYGDGGNAGYDGANPTWRFNEFTSGFTDANFENGDPTKWVIISAPIVNSGEGPSFYWPQIADPNPPAGAHPIFSGARHVWRSWAFGAGVAGNVPQDITPNIAVYEANCPEFVVGGDTPGCGDFRPLGGPYCDGLSSTPTIPSCINQPGDLAGTVYGTDRAGGTISWMARVNSDHGTLWAATSAGRIFVTHNADASDPATVVWHRIDNSSSGNSPTRYPSGITVDPANPNHAWISYSGYNAATPTTPGHVFDVSWDGSTTGAGVFTNLNIEAAGTSSFPTPTNDGDLPTSDVVRDDANKTLYVATDFGVLRGDADGTGGWHVTSGMPRFEITHLEMQPSSRVPTCMGKGACKNILFAATHSRGIWSMNLGN